MSDVTSVIREQRNGPVIAAAAKLWMKPGDSVVDLTYGRGNFWTEYRPDRLVCHDKFTLDGVDFRDLPEDDATYDVVVYDPPYVSPGGRNTSGIQEMFHRYGQFDAPKNPDLLFELIDAGLREGARVLKPKGIMLVKTMDFVWGGRMRWGRQRVIETLAECGLRQVDEFVHYSGTGPQPSGRVQRHSRRAHTFLCVFEKGRVSSISKHQTAML